MVYLIILENSLKIPIDLVSYGGLGDSFYEYLLKQFLLTSKTESFLEEMYLEAIEGLVTKLLYRTNNKLSFIGEYNVRSDSIIKEMDHLVCFVPGMLALGAQELGRRADSHLRLAEQLVQTCYETYRRQATGIGNLRILREIF